ncbi:MAG: LON peptidase substrate-binding domain-containing protein [Pseudomonadota bacterium]|nr:LON peptidase substrate-binding domain-containing protein [Pseudomonadota bacterium]
MKIAVRIALFPLRTVLFPQGLLPLRIFETRYLDMIRRVMREDAGFGVVLIRTGAEVGAITELAEVGTWARVADFDQLPDGLLKIVARGERRFRILRQEIQPDGLHVADVEWIDDAPESLSVEEFPELTAALTRALADLGEEYPAGVPRLHDALWVAGHLGQLLPVPTELRQKILETDGARRRLELIEQLRNSD